MASLAVRNAVVARINSEWNGGSPRCPLSLPNEAFLPPADSGPFLSVQFPVSNEDIMELGPAPNFYREDGAIRLVLCFGINQGTDTALTWIDELRAIFRGQRFDGVVTYAPSPPIEANDNDSGNYYRLSVAIPYEYDFIATEATITAGLPDTTAGFAYIVNADGAHIVNADGAYILAKV